MRDRSRPSGPGRARESRGRCAASPLRSSRPASGSRCGARAPPPWSSCSPGTLLGDEDVPGYRLVFRLVGGAYVACGLIAWRRRPDSYSGLLMTATGFLLFVEPLFMQFDSPVVQTIGELLEDLWSITIIWLVLTLLSGGRLQTTADRVLVGAFVLEFVLEVAWHLFLVQDGNFLLVQRRRRDRRRDPGRQPAARHRRLPGDGGGHRHPLEAGDGARGGGRCCRACWASRRCCSSPSPRPRARWRSRGSRSSRCS